MSTVENELISIERAILYKMHGQFAIKKILLRYLHVR